MPDEEDDLSEMTLSTGGRVLRPLSRAILSALRWFESGGSYFDKSITQNEEKETQRRKIGLYFQSAFAERFLFYAPFAILILVTLTLDRCWLVSFFFPLQAYGLLFDGVGAVILAVGLFRGPDGMLRDTPLVSTGAVYGGDTYYYPKPLSATVRNTVDGVFGGLFLVTGFSIQFMAVTGLSPDLLPC